MKKKVNSFVKVHGNGHAKCVAQSISDSWQKECYSNVRLIAKDCKQPNGESKFLSANKFILAAASKKFAMMLTDTDEDVTIIVPDYDFATLKLLLQYVYSGEVFVDCFTKELCSLIAEWNICYPEVIPVTSTEKSNSNSQNVTKSQIVPENSGYNSIKSINKNTPNKKNPTIVSNDSNIDNYQLAGPDNQLQRQQPKECIVTRAKQKLNSGEEKIPLVDISENLSATATNSNPVVKAPKIPVRNKNKTRAKSLSAAASIPSSGYVFLATYINKSKNKLQERVVTSKTTSEKKTGSIAQVLADGGSTKSVTSPSDESAGNSNVDGEKSNETMDCNTVGENASNRSDNQAAEVDTKDDLQDLASAVKFLKNEKTSNQELNTLMLDLSNEVQRHKSYAKHFLGSDSVNSDSSGQIGMVVFMLLRYLR